MLNSIRMAVILSVPNPSLNCRFVGQFTSIIISHTVASPLKLLLSIVYSSFSSFFSVFFFVGELPPVLFMLPFPELPLLVTLDCFTSLELPRVGLLSFALGV